jgi:signal peptidase
MEPAIKTGSLIFTKSFSEYAIGDVITRRTLDPKVTVTHRIVEKKEVNGNLIYMTKGDANNGEDSESVSPESIIGKVVFDIPYLGYPVSYARTQQGFIILIIIPAVLIIHGELTKIRYEFQKKMRFKKSARKDNDNGLSMLFGKKIKPKEDPVEIKE